MGLGPGFRELDLTDDQKAQLQDDRRFASPEFEAVGKKVGAAREGMRAFVDGDAINEGAIRAKSVEIAAAEADLMILNAKVRQESMQVLTSEQLQKMKELRTAREGQMRQRRDRAASTKRIGVLGSEIRDPISTLRSPPCHSSCPRSGRAGRFRPSNR